LKLSDLLSELETAATSYIEIGKQKTQGSKARRKLENRAYGIRYTVKLMKEILRREIFKKTETQAK